MVQMIIPTQKTESPLSLNIHIQAEVLAAEVARRKANSWLLENAGNLLRADNAELLLEQTLIWRFNVLLTYPTQGIIGSVGQLHLDATTGDVIDPSTIIEQFIAKADALTAR